jgi:hypothetical protein
MTVPLYARYLAAAAGLFLLVVDGASVIGTLIVPRPAGGRLVAWVDLGVHWLFQLITVPIRDYRRRDRVLAAEAAGLLVCQLLAWLAVGYVGFALLLWPFVPGGFTSDLDHLGLAVWFVGNSEQRGVMQRVIEYTAALSGVVIVTLQIAYLPTLYSAFNRRETDVALLNARAGVPSWGPELLARTHYALGSGTSTIDTLPDFYGQWERWAADIAESHTTYLPLVRFRSPRPMSNWVTALLAVLDSAALYLALCPSAAPEVPARLCLRSGFSCFRDVARAMGIRVAEEADPAGGISLSYEDFLQGVADMRKVDFPIEREPAEAWPHFVGWRVNYEEAAYAVALAVDAVPALWSGPRRHPVTPIPPFRPQAGRQQGAGKPGTSGDHGRPKQPGGRPGPEKPAAGS